MRNKLEYIQVIDKYLRGVLNKEDTAIFEKRLTTDSQLREEVVKQELLMEGIKRNALKASAQKGKKKFKKLKTLKTVTILAAVVAITALAVYTFSKTETKPVVQETNQTSLGLESLDDQEFLINTQQDTVIETENGSVFAIPADAFETENGESVSGDIQFEIKEAFDNVDIMKAGLTTTSDGELLETGGMFFLEATHKGEQLRLKNGKEILSQLPNLNPEKEMQLYDGEKKADGTINWVNPKPFEKELITVDITSLDFYPEGYVEEVINPNKIVLGKAIGDIPSAKMTTEQARKLGYKYPSVWTEENALKLGLIKREYLNIKSKNLDIDKEFTDSLYYSFARLFESRNNETKSMSKEPIISEAVAIDDEGNIINLDKRYFDTSYSREVGLIDDSISQYEAVYNCSCPLCCPIPSGINPAKVKVIWNKKFNNTILATKEFEERMKVIHESHQDRILQVYVRNLDKPLWYSDSIAMETFSGTADKFRKFYEQKKRGVNVKDKLAAKLSNYFNKTHKEFTSKSAEAFREFQEKKQQLKQEFQGAKSKKTQDEYNRKAKAFEEEYKINLCNAATQVGKKGYCGETRPINKVRVRRSKLTSRITTLGAKNIDVYVFNATRDRKSMVYKDPVSGKTATLIYKPIKVKITNIEKFDKVYIYLLPDTLSSFNRMKTKDNINFDFSLNMLFSYKLMAIGYKDKQAYLVELNSIDPQDYSISLIPISEEELNNKLNKKERQVKREVLSDKNFYQEEIINANREKKYKSDNQLTLRIGKFLFPELERNCIIKEDIDYNDVSIPSIAL